MSTDDRMTPDPYVEAIIERTVAPYQALVSPAVLESMREALRYALTVDEVGADLVARARPRSAPLESGEEPVEGGGAEGLRDRTGSGDE